MIVSFQTCWEIRSSLSRVRPRHYFWKNRRRSLSVFRADSGPGISEEHLPHIFDRFWQGKKTASGTGLGLSIAKGIVEAHHGKIWVKSNFGEGSTFYFTLPLKRTLSESPSEISSKKKSA